MTHEVFNQHHSETEMLRYIHRLLAPDLSLTTSMIPLGSGTMKLNATSEMLPVTWPEFGHLHPFAPVSQTAGYAELFRQLEAWLGGTTPVVRGRGWRKSPALRRCCWSRMRARRANTRACWPFASITNRVARDIATCASSP